MGKHRKPSKAPGAKVSATANDQDIPSFDENTLSALTEKIEQSLAKGNGQKKLDATAVKSTKQEKLDNSSKQESSKRKSKPQDSRRGTKRDAEGNAKEKTNDSSNMSQDPSTEREILLQEILALGGTEEDLDLVLDAQSDSENEDAGKPAAVDKKFQSEFSKFVASLGIDSKASEVQVDEDEVEEDEAEGEGEGDDWEEASESETSVAEQVSAVLEKSPVEIKESPKDKNRLMFEARADWHAVALPPLPSPDLSESGPYQESIRNLKEYATKLMEEDSKLYSSKHLSATSSHRFLSTIMSSGTLSDKISALTLVVQESPVHTTKSFESLLGLAKKRSRGQAVTALGAMKDLLGTGVVLPADRRLRTFAAQPGLLGTLQQSPISVWKLGQRLPGNITKAHLISWAYEDWLKESYFDMLKILEVWCNDEVEYARSRAVTYVYELLKEKPEQESNLLRLLVNKLGDPEKKIASRASYLLLQLQTSHPLMKPIIVNSIENELLLRPGQSSHAKYYAINTLNQTILSAKEEELAKKLLGIYFGLFVSLLKKPEPVKPATSLTLNKKGEIQGGGAPMGKKAKARLTKEEEAKQASEETTEKLISAVLTGVNRAFPFSKSDDSSLEKHMDTLFRITHSSNFNTSIQALMLIEQFATTKHLAVDRFYRTLYESILDPRLITSSKHALYLNLLYRSLKNDISIKRVKAFVKRMLQIITLHQPPFVCGILYLVRELEVTFPGLASMFKEPEASAEDEDEVFRDVPEDGEAAETQVDDSPKPQEHYDGRKRDPEHSNADKSCLWEIIPFLAHFHPSVSLFADRLLNDEKMPPKPDLASHTLANFLDRFVYRNAKAAAGAPKGSSIMQPLAGGDSRGVFVSSRGAQAQQPVNSEAFWRKKAEDVAVDEVFFHKYFSQIGKSKQPAKKKEAKKGALDDDEEEDEDEIWQALVESKPDIEGPDDDDDDDLDMDDFDISEDEETDGGVDIEGEGEDEDVNMEDIDEDEGDESPGIFDEDEDDLKGSDDEAGSDLDKLFEKELQRAASTEKGGKKKETSREKKRRLKNLPTFASADDYAAMLDGDGDEDMGK